MIKTSLKRVIRGLQSEASTQVAARAFVAKAKFSGLSDSHRVHIHRRVPVISRIDQALRLWECRKHSARTIRSLIQSAGIHYWIIPTDNTVPVCFGVRIEDKQRLWTALQSASPLRNWYCSSVTSNNAVIPPLKRLQSSNAVSNAAVRLWEFVRASSTSTFQAGPLQGVDIQFWTSDTDGIYHSPIWHPRATSLSIAEAKDLDADRIPVAWSAHRHVSESAQKIDVVYTWVDGADDTWLSSKAEAAGVQDVADFTERAHHDARFADHDELRFSLRSLEQFAPWVNKIWIVTAGQTPAWLNLDHPKISVVDHREIWPDAVGLPTFNSHAIEACLHRIPGLSEYFLYLNDDMLFGRPVSPELFFQPSGVSNVFLSRALVDFRQPVDGEIASSTAAKNARDVLKQDFGVVQTQKFYHTAAALRVSVLAELESRHPELFARTRAAAFRTTADIAAAGSLYLNYALASGIGVPGQIRYEYVDPATPDGRARMRRINRTREYDAFCLNDGATDQTEAERETTDLLIRQWLREYLPVPSNFEKNE